MFPNQVTAGLSPLSRALTQLSASATMTAGSLSHLATQPFAALQRGISAVQSQIVSFVQFANPAAVIRFKLAWEDLQGVIGRALAPVLQTVTLIVQRLADYLHAASGPAKGLIAAMAASGVVFAAVTGGIVGMTGALLIFKLVMDTATLGISAVVGLIGAAIGGLSAAGIGAVGLGLVVTPFEQVKEIINQIGPPFLKVFDLIGRAVMQFAQGMLPGVTAAFSSVAAAVSMLVNALPGSGRFFEVIGKTIGVFIQIVALNIQMLAAGFQALASVIGSLVKSILPSVDLMRLLSGGYDKLTAFLMAVSMVIGGETKPDEAPGRAPPAVRQATSQSLSSFITKAYVSAYQTGGGDPTLGRHAETMEKMEAINKEAKKIAERINAFLERAGGAVEGAKTVANNGATAAGAAIGGPLGGMVARLLMSQVTGK
jgi:hypothetical protein